MYASEQMYRIDATIARTNITSAHRIELLTLESQNCQQARSMIAYEITAKRMEYDLLVTRTRAERMPWEIRGPILENMAQKLADDIAQLNEEYAAFGEAMGVADDHIRRLRARYY